MKPLKIMEMTKTCRYRELKNMFATKIYKKNK